MSHFGGTLRADAWLHETNLRCLLGCVATEAGTTTSRLLRLRPHADTESRCGDEPDIDASETTRASNDMNTSAGKSTGAHPRRETDNEWIMVGRDQQHLHHAVLDRERIPRRQIASRRALLPEMWCVRHRVLQQVLGNATAKILR